MYVSYLNKTSCYKVLHHNVCCTHDDHNVIILLQCKGDDILSRETKECIEEGSKV